MSPTILRNSIVNNNSFPSFKPLYSFNKLKKSYNPVKKTNLLILSLRHFSNGYYIMGSKNSNCQKYWCQINESPVFRGHIGCDQIFVGYFIYSCQMLTMIKHCVCFRRYLPYCFFFVQIIVIIVFIIFKDGEYRICV